MTDTPLLDGYSRHLLICTRGCCAPAEDAAALQAEARRLLGRRSDKSRPDHVKVNTTDCLGICEQGPIAVVYPDGVWYRHVTADVLARIVHEHLMDNCPVSEYIFYQK